MSNVKRKPARAVLCLVLAVVVAFTFLLATSAVFADSASEKVSCSFTTDGVPLLNQKVVGTADLHDAMNVSTPELIEGKTNQYRCTLSANVEASDLFDEAYAYYEQNFENKRTVFGYYKNIVMSDKNDQGNEAYPTIEYVVKFPSNITVDTDDVKATENTDTINGITAKPSAHQVDIEMKLGNWDDYAGFFNRVAGELNQTGHQISVSIPVTIDASSSANGVFGTVTGNGDCHLFKFGHFKHGNEIVSVTSRDSWNITKQGAE